MEQSEYTKYTVIPILAEQHRIKLENYLKKDNQNLKTSYCRFYLRGNCIMKPQYCKFGHSFQQLKISQNYFNQVYATEKQRRKKQFQEKKDFNQKALFIIKNIDYVGLYNYQFSQRFQKKGLPIENLASIKEDNKKRIKIRQVLHRQNWDKFIYFLEEKYPNVDYTFTFLNYWYQKVGFAKPQSRCKFGDFMRYLIFVLGYKEIDIIVPPRSQPTIFFINTKQSQTYLQQSLTNIIQIQKTKLGQNKIIILKQLPQQLRKKYICRYNMAGNCQNSPQQCGYAHNISQLKYIKGQKFPLEYRQPSKSPQFRLNYYSLYYYFKLIGRQISLEQLNSNLLLRNELRAQFHKKIYFDFVNKVEQVWNIKHIPLSLLERQYNNAGFNHTDQNKFQQLEGVLWDIGYHVQDVQMPPLLKKKKTYLYKLPSLQTLKNRYHKIIQSAITQQLCKVQQNQQILESTIKRNIYSTQQYFDIPLHIYIKIRKCTLQKLIEQDFKQYYHRIFFQTGQQNYKKLTQLIKNYLKSYKKYIYKLDQIQRYVRQQHQNTINLNNFINVKQLIQLSLLENHKKIYFFPFCQNIIVIDKQYFLQHQKYIKEKQKKIKQKYIQKNGHKNQIPQKLNKYINQRIVIIENIQNLQYAKLVLFDAKIYGVDLEGKLKKNGKIDLIQFSAYNTIGNKQIFIFDLFQMSSNQGQEYWNSIDLLKTILEDQSKVKVLHDCRQDSQALYYVLGIAIKNVFDTSGMDTYFQQKQIYNNQIKWDHLLRKVHNTKVPALNTVLDKWQAPNGINIFKDSMKNKFKEHNRKYFQQRPIDPQFLEYSAQDVQDLIQIYQNMKKKDDEHLSYYIGELYSKLQQFK